MNSKELNQTIANAGTVSAPKKLESVAKPILWVNSTKTKARIPLDLDLPAVPLDAPVTGAIFFISDDQSKGAPIANASAVLTLIQAGKLEEVDVMFDGAEKPRRVDVKRFGINHYKTCPNAGQFGLGQRREPTKPNALDECLQTRRGFVAHADRIKVVLKLRGEYAASIRFDGGDAVLDHQDY